MPNQLRFSVHGAFVGPAPATGLHFTSTGCLANSGNRVRELLRIQDASYDFNFQRENITQFGDLASLDQVPTTWPTVNLNLTYLQANAENEKLLGLVVSSGQLISALSGIVTQETEDKNYFITIDKGHDQLHGSNLANDSTLAPGSIIAVGNGVLNSYTAQGAVGQFPTVSVGIEALNLKVYDIDASLKNVYENDMFNLHFDDVKSGDPMLGPLGWSVSHPFRTGQVLGNVDPRMIYEQRRPNARLIVDQERNALFTSKTTGTDWVKASTGSFVYIDTGTQQLVMHRQFGGANTYFSIPKSVLVDSRFSTGKWYEVVIDIAEVNGNVHTVQYGGTNDNCIRNIFGEIEPNISVPGVYSGIYFSTGATMSPPIITFAGSTTGSLRVNSFQLNECRNFSWQLSGAGTGEFPNNPISLFPPTNFLIQPKNRNRLYQIDFESKASGSTFSALMTPCYIRLGSQTEGFGNLAGFRSNHSDFAADNTWRHVSWKIPNSYNTTQAEGFVLARNTISWVDNNFGWVDNLKITSLPRKMIIHPNEYMGNGSFEYYSDFSSGDRGTGAGQYIFSCFNNWSTFHSTILWTGAMFTTGKAKSVNTTSFRNSDDCYDSSQTNAISAFTKIINKTGSATYAVDHFKNLNYPGTGTIGLEDGKRYTLQFYAKYSGANTTDLGTVQGITYVNSFQNPSYILSNTAVPADNSWNFYKTSWINTGNVNRLDLYFTFDSTCVTNDNFELDEVLLWENEDCYELPTVTSGLYGFNIPYSNTNISGFTTNSNTLSVSTLNPRDTYVQIAYSDLGVSTGDWKLQSYNINVPLNRESVYKLDSRFPDKNLAYPIVGTISVNALVGDMKTGTLFDLYNICGNTYDIRIGTFLPCSDKVGIEYLFRKAKLQGMEYSSSVGGNTNVNATYQFTVGGPFETGYGFFISGVRTPGFIQ
jgi:hypothetical protein